MAATLKEIREGLAANLAAIANVQVSAYMLDRPEPPTLQVMGPDEVVYDLAAGRGLDQWLIVVQGFVGAVADRGSQVRLDEWLAPSGATSVKAALETDKTLGSKVQTLRVVSSSGYQKYSLPAGEVLGCEWSVQVFNKGT